MNPVPTLLVPLLVCFPAISLYAAVGSAETGDVTVDTRIAGPRLTVGPSLPRANAKNANLVSRRTRPVRGFARVANVGNFADVLALRGARGDRFLRVAYQAPSGNVTAPAILGTYRTPALASGGGSSWLRATVLPNRRLLVRRNAQGRQTVLRRTLNLPLRATSNSLPPAADAARIRVRTL